MVINSSLYMRNLCHNATLMKTTFIDPNRYDSDIKLVKLTVAHKIACAIANFFPIIFSLWPQRSGDFQWVHEHRNWSVDKLDGWVGQGLGGDWYCLTQVHIHVIMPTEWALWPPTTTLTLQFDRCSFSLFCMRTYKSVVRVITCKSRSSPSDAWLAQKRQRLTPWYRYRDRYFELINGQRANHEFPLKICKSQHQLAWIQK